MQGLVLDREEVVRFLRQPMIGEDAGGAQQATIGVIHRHHGVIALARFVAKGETDFAALDDPGDGGGVVWQIDRIKDIGQLLQLRLITGFDRADKDRHGPDTVSCYPVRSRGKGSATGIGPDFA